MNCSLPVAVSGGGFRWPRRPTSSAGAPLKLPCCLEGVGDGLGVTAGEVSDHHHVLEVPVGHAEGAGKLSQHGVAVIEVGPDHHMGVVELAGHQPAVVAPLGPPVRHRLTYARQGRREPGDVRDLHYAGLADGSAAWRSWPLGESVDRAAYKISATASPTTQL